MRRFNMSWTTLYSNSTTVVFLPATRWMSAPDIEKVRVVWEVIGLMSDLTVRPGYQLAQVEGAPGTSHDLGGAYVSDNDVVFETVDDIGSNTDAVQLIRFGWRVKLSTGSTLALARVAGTVATWSRC